MRQVILCFERKTQTEGVTRGQISWLNPSFESETEPYGLVLTLYQIVYEEQTD